MYSRPAFLILLVSTILLIVFYFSSHKNSPSSIKETIAGIVEILNEEQIKKDSGFLPPFSFIERTGLYKSYVKMNFFGTYPKALLRHYFSVPDSNMFVSNFVSLSLLEAWEIGTIDLPLDQLEIAVNAILSFKDRNNNETDIYCFWHQELVEKYFVASPLNLIYGIEDFMKIASALKFVLDNTGFDNIYQEYVAPLVEEFSIYRDVFKIPSDSDDSSVNFALYARLYESREYFPDLYKNWTNVNSHLNETLQAYLKYSYKPFSNSLDTNLTDSRTYYFIRDFLKIHENDTNFSLISTWITNLSEDSIRYPEVGMPLHVNNVDLSVNTNSLFGLSHILLIHPELATPELLKLYSDVTELIVWAIDTELVLKRPDIAILYYPSVFDFYWFVARILSFLEKSDDSLKFPEMRNTKEKLAQILRTKGVSHITNLVKYDEKNQRVYWEDFLGTNDAYPTGEDRLFSTALALNIMIDSYSNYSNNTYLKLRDDTPKSIIDLIDQSTKFINEEILNDNYDKENAFFSGSIKGNSSTPFYYPVTFAEYINGSAINSSNIDFMKLTTGIPGVINETTYEYLLNKTWSGQPVPESFPGFNEKPFPYWSSPAMTYAMSLIGLSKYEAIINSRNN